MPALSKFNNRQARNANANITGLNSISAFRNAWLMPVSSAARSQPGNAVTMTYETTSPNTPPISVCKRFSQRICVTSSRRVAPKARRTPISAMRFRIRLSVRPLMLMAGMSRMIAIINTYRATTFATGGSSIGWSRTRASVMSSGAPNSFRRNSRCEAFIRSMFANASAFTLGRSAAEGASR